MSIEVPPGEKIDTEAVEEALQTAVEADEAAAALKRQIEAIHEAEALQRQQAGQMMAAQRPLTREQKLDFWRQQGLTDEETKFLQANPEMIDNSAVTNHAAALALQEGHERDSESYFAAVKNNFDEHMQQMQAQAAATAPEFWRPPAPRASAPPSSAYVSAPVSREVPTGGERQLTPSQVRLSAEEQEIARASGISLRTYAENKIRLMKEKASGQRQ